MRRSFTLTAVHSSCFHILLLGTQHTKVCSSPSFVLWDRPQRGSDPCCPPLSSACGSRRQSCGGPLCGTWASLRRVHSGAAHRASPLPAARVLEVSGREGLPRGCALRQGGHQHARQRVPGGEVRTVFKVMGDTVVCILGTRWCSSLPTCDSPLFFLTGMDGTSPSFPITQGPSCVTSVLCLVSLTWLLSLLFLRERAVWGAWGEGERNPSVL